MKQLFYLLFFLTACNPSKNEEFTSKQEKSSILIDSTRIEVINKTKEVMDVHDFAMEKMGEMVKLKKALSDKKSILDSSQLIVCNQAIKDLEDADKIMWDWMHGYKATIVDTSSIDVALSYLADQKVKVDLVDFKIKKSLKNGYNFLENENE